MPRLHRSTPRLLTRRRPRRALYLLYLLYLLYCLLYLLRTGGQAARSTCEALTLSLTLTFALTKARAYEEYKRGQGLELSTLLTEHKAGLREKRARVRGLTLTLTPALSLSLPLTPTPTPTLTSPQI